MSSPGGGFYKYRCKYFLSHDCKNWVWVNDTPCSTCLVSGLLFFSCPFFSIVLIAASSRKANGRDDEKYPTAAWAAWAASRDIMAPFVSNGILQYAHMEVAVSEQGEESLIVRSKALRPPPAVPVTTMMPRGGSIMASAH
ncbi:hypothetical protein LLEC1_07537 [Akanthomyces lecanii]|uniref:Uncharacterized protein n=1 Tax=Cordyceps confragosa TaxID=2714763 RepID=A0A179IT32_CORDF|nr:hypothetical protein LLEC1_07537 [Akanthomyces lecanii]